MEMMAAVYRGPGRVGVETAAVPEAGEGDLLLRVRAASICATDLKIAAHGHFKIPAGTPRILGHEFVGEVVAGGGEYPELQRGARVGVAPNVGCGRCPACIRGLDNLCPSYEAIGITLDGALAEYVRIPAVFVRRGNVIPIAPEVPDEEAALIEPMSCVLAAHEAAATGPGDRVLVMGAGPMGLMHILYARAAGASLVIALDPLPVRRDYALRFGADGAATPEELEEAIRRFTGGEGFEVVIVSVPLREAQERAVQAASIQGRIHFFAGLPRGSDLPTLDVNAIHYRQLVVTGTTGAGAWQYRRAALLVARRRFILAPLVSERIGLDEAAGVLSSARPAEGLKTIVYPRPGRSF